MTKKESNKHAYMYIGKRNKWNVRINHKQKYLGEKNLELYIEKVQCYNH